MNADRLSEHSDVLVRWVSERGAGSWQQFRAACETLTLEPSRAARGLSQLGHAEFDWHQSRFCAAPTALVALPGLDGHLFLTGARNADVLAALEIAISRLDADATVCDPVPQHGPSTILVECDPRDAVALAGECDIQLEPVAGRLADQLPAVSVEWAGERRAPDERFPHVPVDPQRLRPNWRSELGLGAEGLWRFTGRRRYGHYLRRADGWWYFPTREYAPYLAYPQAPALAYISAQWILTCRVPLPPLHARCAALASGRLPYRKPIGDDGYEEWYIHVDPQTATLIAASLNVPLPERES